MNQRLETPALEALVAVVQFGAYGEVARRITWPATGQRVAANARREWCRYVLRNVREVMDLLHPDDPEWTHQACVLLAELANRGTANRELLAFATNPVATICHLAQPEYWQ